jgi:hypothetical protein
VNKGNPNVPAVVALNLGAANWWLIGLGGLGVELFAFRDAHNLRRDSSDSIPHHKNLKCQSPLNLRLNRLSLSFDHFRIHL